MPLALTAERHNKTKNSTKKKKKQMNTVSCYSKAFLISLPIMNNTSVNCLNPSGIRHYDKGISYTERKTWAPITGGRHLKTYQSRPQGKVSRSKRVRCSSRKEPSRHLRLHHVPHFIDQVHRRHKKSSASLLTEHTLNSQRQHDSRPGRKEIHFLIRRSTGTYSQRSSEPWLIESRQKIYR